MHDSYRVQLRTTNLKPFPLLEQRVSDPFSHKPDIPPINALFSFRISSQPADAVPFPAPNSVQPFVGFRVAMR